MHKSRHSKMLGLALLGVIAGSTCCVPTLVQAQDADVNALITELQGSSVAQTRSAEQMQAAYNRALEALLPDMSNADLNKRGDTQDKWERIALRASRPGAEAERVAAARAMLPRLGTETPLETRRWLLKQLENMGRAESVPTLVNLLNDQEPLIKENARRALTNNPSNEAAQALRTALERATTAEWRIAFINALGQRQDTASISNIARYAGGANANISSNAIAALSSIGGPNAIQALNTLKGTANPQQRKLIIDALLLSADKLLKQGNKTQAAAIYQTMYMPAESKGVRIAALRGLVAARGEAAIPLIGQVLGGNDAEMRITASRLMGDVPGAPATRAFAALLPKLSAEGQLALIDELGSRGDTAARTAILEATKSKNENVRLAALRALGGVGNATDVTFLAQTAATTTGAENEAARTSLARLRGQDVNDSLIKSLTGANSKLRTELIRALSARYASEAVTPLVAVLQDMDANVRTEAVSALGVLGDARVLPSLVTLIARTKDEDQQQVLTNAISAIVNNIPDKSAGSAAVLAGLQNASAATRLALIPVLKATGGPAALDVVRTATKDANADVQTTAIRTLAGWPDAAPIPDLLQIAQNDPKEAHQVLALRGYVDLVKKSDRAPADKVKLYRDALATTKRNDVRTAILSGIGEVNDPEALRLAATYLSDDALKEDAASAVVKIAKNIGGAAGPDLKPLMNRVIATTKNEATTRTATEVISLADIALRGWQVLGPFPVENTTVAFEKDFGPEKGVNLNQSYPVAGGKMVNWRPVTIQPNGLVALEKQLDPHDNVAGYALVYVKSPDARKATVSVGSDDGIKAWINGQQVISNNANRAASPGQDEAQVDLKAGWNEVLLKITQGGGEWGYYFDLLDTQKKPMTDIQYAARPQG